MLTKYLFYLLIVSAPLISMELESECTIQINIDGAEVIKRKVTILLRESDPVTQSIIKDLLTQEPTKKSSPEQRKQKSEILRKISESDE